MHIFFSSCLCAISFCLTLHPNSIMNTAHLPLSCRTKIDFSVVFLLLWSLFMRMQICKSLTKLFREKNNPSFEWTLARLEALHPIECWCEYMMPKNSSYEIFVAYDNNERKSRTHAGSPEKFNTFYMLQLLLGSTFYLTVIFQVARNFLLPHWQHLLFANLFSSKYKHLT